MLPVLGSSWDQKPQGKVVKAGCKGVENGYVLQLTPSNLDGVGEAQGMGNLHFMITKGLISASFIAQGHARSSRWRAISVLRVGVPMGRALH